VHKLAQLDHRHVWHPFTQMKDWLKREPIVITSGQGAVLRDARGREYLDANSSIWTNLHGHNHPRLNAALARQAKKISHSSALGFANEPASLLAAELVQVANPPSGAGPRASRSPAFLSKVFYSDNGSTALEVALKLSYEFARRTRRLKKPRFLSLDGAYHGDTIGAVSLGHIDLFHKAYGKLLFQSDKVMAPYCYRCPFNRAQPERDDARKYRQCGWECIGLVEKTFAARQKRAEPYAAFVFEPLLQGAAGMIPQPSGWLKQASDIARGHGAQLIADEVMTGFGRAGVTCHITKETIRRAVEKPEHPRLFACTRVGVQPDYLCLAKGLTGGYLPMAATLTTQPVFDAFLGEYDEFKTFFHGHSYTSNQLGAATARASLELLRSAASVRARGRLQEAMHEALKSLWALPNVGDIRQVGLMAGVELVRDWRTRAPFALGERAGIRVCEAMAKRGVLTRPIGNVLVLMPPYCTTPSQTRRMVEVLHDSVEEVLGKRSRPATREQIGPILALHPEPMENKTPGRLARGKSLTK
jgi:adenosylmethionine-8-amino-7-oxononanoate aminotransferase